MSELVTDAMVEEALEGSYDPPKEPGYTFLNRDAYRSLWSHHMRAALEAVAPAIAAKALRDFDNRTMLPREWHERVLEDALRVERGEL